MARKIELRQTDDYALFEESAFNRDVGNLDVLRSSMRENGFLPAYPLHCVPGTVSRYAIKAGHRRFNAAKLEGKPVYYVVLDDTVSMVDLEKATKVWRNEDFIRSYFRQGSVDYAAILEWHEATGISLTQVASMLYGDCANSGNANKAVKSGRFVVKDEDHILKVSTVVDAIRREGFEWYKNNNFVSAVSSCCFLPEFDIAAFIQKCKVNRADLRQQGSRDQYLEMIERIFNKRRSETFSLAFAAKESAKKRNACRKKENTDSAK